MTDYVVDTSSVLAAVFGEPGADMIDTLMAEADARLLISSVNMVEVVSKLVDRGMPPETIQQVLLPLGLEEIAFDSSQTAFAAGLRTATRSHGLSLGDRCCLALAKARGLAVLTADRQWSEVAEAIGVTVVITRPAAAH